MKTIVTVNLIPLSKGKRPGTKSKKTGITVHNTANPKSTAMNERNWLANPSNNRVASWHYCIDQNSVVQAIPEDEIAYHAGSDKGNTVHIGVEVCESGNQDIVWKNAVKFIAEKLHENNWDINAVRTHKSWSGKECPRLLLPKWDMFIADIKKELSSLKGEVEDMAKTNSTIIINGKKQSIETVIFENSNYINVRKFAEALGCSVDWDGKNIIVNKKVDGK